MGQEPLLHVYEQRSFGFTDGEIEI
jgi:hypothetical protein